MNDTMKAVTIGLIAIAIYIALKHGQPTNNGSGQSLQNNPGRLLEVSPCGTAIPLQTSTCNIPLASDYLYEPISFTPATAPISTRGALLQPLDSQTRMGCFLGPVNVAYDTQGNTVTPVPATCMHHFTSLDCALLDAQQACTVKV